MIPAIQRDRSDSDRHFNAAYHFRHRALDLRTETLYQRTLKLVTGHRLKLARPAYFLALDPLASQHAFFLDRGDGSADLAVGHGSSACLFGFSSIGKGAPMSADYPK
jgi:hypothetical protein